jgi:hypothetical protein
MNASWILVNSNCSHTVTVTIHTVSLYKTGSRTGRTQDVRIGKRSKSTE